MSAEAAFLEIVSGRREGLAAQAIASVLAPP